MFARLLVGFFLLAVLPCLAAPVVPAVQLARGALVLNLAPKMALNTIPLRDAATPDALWSLPLLPSTNPPDQWEVDTGQRVVGRVLLLGSREPETLVLLVPSPRMD